MVNKTVQFNCDDALQMKAVAVLIQKASTFRSSVYLSKGERKANAKSLLGVMSLGVENAMELNVSADGSDEVEALETITNYLNNPEF
ncbi:MAG: HPr family phosphocarrier protein [Eubacteriales bacterium]|nr:HPr family phosphocarrier protein [Eubacteriales bacterium]